MKKLISIILLVCLCFSVSACGGKSEPAPVDSGPGTSSLSSGTEKTDAKINMIDLREQAGAEDVSEIFDYGDGFVGAIIKRTVDGEKKTFLRFIDTNYGWLAEGEYELGGSDFVFTVDRGDSHYVCFENSTVEVSGDPRAVINVEPIDFRYSYERDDNLLYSPDGRWYATREPDDPDKKGDAVVVEVATGEKTVPYEGVKTDNFEDTTASVPVGFAGSKFIFNIIGYEWMNGYGVIDLEDNSVETFATIYNLGAFPSTDHKTDRVPYLIEHEEFGYFDVNDPLDREPLYNADQPVRGKEAFSELLDGTTYFFPVSLAGGKYLGVVAETAQNEMLFAAFDFDTFEKVCEHKESDYFNSYTLSGNSAAFLFESVSESKVLVITLP